MPYTKIGLKTGDIITQVALDHYEQGILDATQLVESAGIDITELEVSQSNQDTLISNHGSAIEGISTGLQTANSGITLLQARFDALVTALENTSQVQQPFIKSYDDNGNSSVFTLPKTPTVIMNVYVLSASEFHLLQDDDFSVVGNTVTVTNPTMTTGNKIKVLYTAKEVS